MTLANKITILRILLIPVFIITYTLDHRVLAAFILAISLLTDFLDGTIARKFKQKTELGTLLDPTADKLFTMSAILTLTLMNKIPLWAFIIFFSKDLILSLGWFYIYILTQNREISPRMLGKINTSAQMIMVLMVVVNLPLFLTLPVIVITACLTIASTLDYIILGSKKLNGKKVEYT